MVDTLTAPERSERMRLIRNKDTKPEMIVRRLIYGMGYRYRLHRRDLPGCPDLVFPRYRKVLFVHGCFWHRHPDPLCKLARLPKSNLNFWLPKLERNRSRDERNQEALLALGWEFMIVWECELKDINKLENRIQMFLEGNK